MCWKEISLTFWQNVVSGSVCQDVTQIVLMFEICAGKKYVLERNFFIIVAKCSLWQRLSRCNSNSFNV